MSALTHAERRGADVDVAGETLTLLPERAAYWPARRTLLLADWHLGKAGVFGRRGLAIPDGDAAQELRTLTALLAATGASRVVVLGDLMHAPPRDEDDWPALLAAWLAAHPRLELEVVAGNHDRVRADALPAGLAARIGWHADAVDEGPFRLDHEPGSAPGRYTIAGHLHPTRRLVVGADRVRAPAFWLRPDSAVLPAFGTFTGGVNIRPAAGDRVFVTGPDAVVEVPV